MESRAETTNSTGVPFKKLGTGLVLILFRIPAKSNSYNRKPKATPSEYTSASSGP